MFGPERFSPVVRLIFIVVLILLCWSVVFLVVSLALTGVQTLTTELSWAGPAHL